MVVAPRGDDAIGGCQVLKGERATKREARKEMLYKWARDAIGQAGWKADEGGYKVEGGVIKGSEWAFPPIGGGGGGGKVGPAGAGEIRWVGQLRAVLGYARLVRIEQIQGKKGKTAQRKKGWPRVMAQLREVGGRAQLPEGAVAGGRQCGHDWVPRHRPHCHWALPTVGYD